MVYGLPRGGVIVAREVADEIGCPLDLIMAAKLTHPRNPEYAIGAITDDGETILNPDAVASLPGEFVEEEKARKVALIQERRRAYLSDRLPLPVEGKTAIVVDDGIATGLTVKAAVLSLRRRSPKAIVVAAPVAPPSVDEEFAGLADEVIVPHRPSPFYAVGTFYENFAGVSDAEVIAALR